MNGIEKCNMNLVGVYHSNQIRDAGKKKEKIFSNNEEKKSKIIE